MAHEFKLYDESIIIDCENKLYKRYIAEISDYIKAFSLINCNVIVEQCWTVDNEKKAYLEHPKNYKNYVYWLSYRIVDQFNNPLIYDDENSCLENSEGFLSVHKKCNWFNKKIYFQINITDDMSSILDDLNTHYNFVKNHIV